MCWSDEQQADKIKRPTEPCDCLGWPDHDNTGSVVMATLTLAQALDRTKAREAQLRTRLHCAARTLALQAALNATKLRLRAKGFRVSDFTRKELVAHAEIYLADHREELIANAKIVVAGWAASGVLGKRTQKAYQQAQQGQEGVALR
jgi:hypothetical protein